MEIAERGPRRPRAGTFWIAGAVVICGLEVWVASFGLGIMWLVAVVTAAAFGIKAYAAFTGTKRFGKATTTPGVS